ncbi:alpha/beta fold hydrolase [Bdellovibrio sp. HCB274]|uniref:alpha/beta fold hydrolase n=1 Tax=Bdellovibrio sp. HCB274 TaxID=3394361 RepID=UPI0039B44060
MKLILLLSLLFSGLNSFAQPFVSGSELRSKYQSIISQENGFLVDVPVDYRDSSKGTFKIYGSFYKGYDSNLPTLVYVQGGPGFGSHYPLGSAYVEHMKLDGFNLLLFDTRGTGLSVPEKEEQYRSPSFYGSETIARDIQKIIKHFSISKVSVYAVSYGTVPATIFASLFPEYTTALVLEGVVYGPTTEFEYKNDHLIRLYQRCYDLLSPGAKDLVNKISTGEPSWFTSTLNSAMSGSGKQGCAITSSVLDKLSSAGVSKENALRSFQEELGRRYSGIKIEYNELTYQFNSEINDITYAKEFGNGSDKDYSKIVLVDGLVQRVAAKNSSYAASAKEYGISYDKSAYYWAHKYPVKVPVSYLIGYYDTFTMMPGALEHFRKVPKGFAQAVIAMEFGHTFDNNFKLMGLQNPEFGNLAELFKKQIFLNMVKGQPLVKVPLKFKYLQK